MECPPKGSKEYGRVFVMIVFPLRLGVPKAIRAIDNGGEEHRDGKRMLVDGEGIAVTRCDSDAHLGAKLRVQSVIKRDDESGHALMCKLQESSTHLAARIL